MKLDKETLVKHQFWIGFGVLLLLIVVTLFWLSQVSAEGNATEKQKLDNKMAELGKYIAAAPKNKNDIQVQKDRVALLEKRREEIWEKAWKMQEELMTWPPSVQSDMVKLGFGEEIKDDGVRDRYSQNNAYARQVKQLGEIFRVKTTIDKEEKTFDLVQFKDRKVLTVVDDWTKLRKAPTSEEVWLAQEDIWVQREILIALYNAINNIARLKKVEGGPAPAKGELFREPYANAQWKLDLALLRAKEGYALKGRIQNVTDHPLPLGKIYFLVYLHQGDPKPVVLPVEGPMLPAGKDWPIPELPLNLAAQPDGILGVTQLYDTRTSPIRRLDDIVLGAQAHRTYQPQLRMAKFSEKASAGSPKPTPRPGDPPPRDLTPHGLVRERYLDINEQVRRMPVAVVLLVDQGHIPEVLASLTNSKLRLQIVQVGWQHFRGSLATPDAGLPRGPDGQPGVGTTRPPVKVGQPVDAGQEQQSNLVELTVYCVASLYERYQPGRSTAATPPPIKTPPAKAPPTE
jgi:hypothetical protein